MNETIANRLRAPVNLHPSGAAALIIGLAVVVGLTQMGLEPAWLVAFPSASAGATLLALLTHSLVPSVVALVLLSILNAVAIVLFAKPELFTYLGPRARLRD